MTSWTKLKLSLPLLLLLLLVPLLPAVLVLFINENWLALVVFVLLALLTPIFTGGPIPMLMPMFPMVLG